MSQEDRHERAMYDALRDEEERRKQALRESYGVLYPAERGHPEYVSLYGTLEEAQREQYRNGSIIVRVQLSKVKP